jgi:hypothetical protein
MPVGRFAIACAAALGLVAAAGCQQGDDRRPQPGAAPVDPRSSLVDLTATLDPLRAAFDAHRGEARFIALLSPS